MTQASSHRVLAASSPTGAASRRPLAWLIDSGGAFRLTAAGMVAAHLMEIDQFGLHAAPPEPP